MSDNAISRAAGRQTKDPVNEVVLDVVEEIGFQRFGVMQNEAWYDDPRHLVFTLARYKFVSKMLAGKHKVAEVGCGDAFASRVVKQEVGDLTVTDYDPLFIEDIVARDTPRWPMTAKVHDILQGPVSGGPYDAVYSLDVMEHIHAEHEHTYLTHVAGSLTAGGVAVIGMPSLESQTYAGPASRAGHVNCKSGPDLKAIAEKYFENVFIFSMNDEVVHTGYQKMAHYLFALCCRPIAAK
jgi:2-polyprenyl-3-methyl-5-hydroxy-6-metoxy-1,4-benzoquinol methylase